MSTAGSDTGEFEHDPLFSHVQSSEGLGLGPLEARYQQLFADVLADGVITPEERAELDTAAGDLGLDRLRLLRLEQAMMTAYEQRHRVRIVERYEEAPRSLALPLPADNELASPALLRKIEQLEARVRELETELRRAEASVNVEVSLAEVEAFAEQVSEDPEDHWRRIRRDPTRPDAYHALYRIFSARAELDKQWCVAQALVALGAASPEEQTTFERFRRLALPQPRQGLAVAAWDELLLHPEQDVVTGQIFGVIVPAVLLSRVTGLRRDGKLHVPRPEALQDGAKSTITAVRALPWAAAILGLSLPAIYVEKEREAGYEHMPGMPPVSVLGKRVLSGLSPLEHAFLAGRHLAWYRQEHYIKVLFSAVPDLEDLFLAALTVANPGLPLAPEVKRRVAPIAAAIEPVLDTGQLDKLRALLARFIEEGGRTNLLRWSNAVEKTTCRAGLMICGDLGTALHLLAAEEGPGGELANDLLCFATGSRYFALRAALGIAVEP